MAQRDEVGRPLGRLDPRHPSDRQHVALAHRVGRHLGRGLRLHVHPAASHSSPVGGFLGRDVDHPRTPEGIEMRETPVGHGEQSTSEGLTGRRGLTRWTQTRLFSGFLYISARSERQGKGGYPPIWDIERSGRMKVTWPMLWPAHLRPTSASRAAASSSSDAPLRSSERRSVSRTANRQLRSLPSAVSRTRSQVSQNGWVTLLITPTSPRPSRYRHTVAGAEPRCTGFSG